jgi:beta-N-acetylhexosaminidase
MRILGALVALGLAIAPIPGQTGTKGKAVAPKSAPKAATEMQQARYMLRTMSLRDRVAQLVMGMCYGDVYDRKSPDFERFRHWMSDLHLGGLIMINDTENGLRRPADPHAMAIFLNQMQRLSKLPLLVGADFEYGASMRVRGGAVFPWAMAFGAIDDVQATRYEGLTTAREARALGVHWVFAPVADVNNNPENPVINIRSFSEDPEKVARHVAAFIEGAHSDPGARVLVTAKHFPGHGDTNVNSHIGLPNLDATREHLNNVELKPFEAAIASGVDAVMTAHMVVPALESEEIPATVSAKVLNNVLREELKFQNLIVTDAMNMDGLTKQFNAGEAAVRSVAAGADVLLLPPDPERAINAVVAAVESGRLPRKRIDDSASRVLAAKIRLGLMRKKLVDLDAISDVIDSAESAAKAQEFADRAVTLVRNDGNLIPLSPANKPCLVMTLERRTSGVGVRMVSEFQRRVRDSKTFLLDSTLPRAALDAAVGDTSSCSALVIVSSVTPATARRNYTLAGDLGPFIQDMTDGKTPVVLVSLGSPYLLTSFPKSAAYLATFSPNVPSEISAAKALFGEIPISGHLPVSIPGFAQIGEGITVPGRAR